MKPHENDESVNIYRFPLQLLKERFTIQDWERPKVSVNFHSSGKQTNKVLLKLFQKLVSFQR
ncbi:hypothetical protein [Hominenteromicrobium sp.]|uniref:hypothetical protein n=1 Tax=Hominenteromicrobium sp. TaxID=3073581 RepID=UPI00399A78DC